MYFPEVTAPWWQSNSPTSFCFGTGQRSRAQQTFGQLLVGVKGAHRRSVFCVFFFSLFSRLVNCKTFFAIEESLRTASGGVLQFPTSLQFPTWMVSFSSPSVPSVSQTSKERRLPPSLPRLPPQVFGSAGWSVSGADLLPVAALGVPPTAAARVDPGREELLQRHAFVRRPSWVGRVGRSWGRGGWGGKGCWW